MIGQLDLSLSQKSPYRSFRRAERNFGRGEERPYEDKGEVGILPLNETVTTGRNLPIRDLRTLVTLISVKICEREVQKSLQPHHCYDTNLYIILFRTERLRRNQNTRNVSFYLRACTPSVKAIGPLCSIVHVGFSLKVGSVIARKIHQMTSSIMVKRNKIQAQVLGIRGFHWTNDSKCQGQRQRLPAV
jgi:hypothetical protein